MQYESSSERSNSNACVPECMLDYNVEDEELLCFVGKLSRVCVTGGGFILQFDFHCYDLMTMRRMKMSHPLLANLCVFMPQKLFWAQQVVYHHQYLKMMMRMMCHH